MELEGSPRIYMPNSPLPTCLPGWLTTRAKRPRLRRWSSTGSWTPVDYERIDMEGVSVSVAEDYSKRRHVLKLSSTCSSEILLQADSQSDMNRWLHALHHDNNNTQSIGSVASTSGTSKASSSSSLSNKLGFRNRSPTGSSPTSKNRKPSQTDGSQPGCSGVGGVNAGTSSSSSVNVGASTSGATPAVVVAPPPKEKEKVKKENWSKRLAGGLMFNKKSPSPTIHYPEGATIGVPIQLCPESTNLEGIPLLVEMCINLVEERGLDAIGIYRVPGNTAAVTSLTEAVNRGLDDSVLEQDPRYSDVNVISSLLKSFFRRLPDCLLTSELYPQFIEADKIQDPKTRVAVLRRLVHELPPQNFNTLRYLLFHLKNVMDNCEVNKMEPRNLAIVFGPTLIKAGDNNMMTLVNDMSHQCRIVETLLLYVDWVYSDGDLEELELREDTYSSELAESELNNQSLLLDNIHKVEGLKESPTRDMSAKDIVSSIISAANRKMQKAKRGKSIVSITEENLPTPTDNSIETSKHNNTSNTKSEKGDPPGACRAVDRSAGAATQAPVQTRNTSAMTLVASHVRQSVLFSGSVASKILSSNDSQQDKSNEERNAGNDSKDNSSEQSNTSELDSNKNAVKENKDLNEMSKSVEGGTIRSYTGLHQVTQERVRRFEMETKAMLHREPRKRDELNTSLSAIGQSITSSKEAVDKIGKRLKTCKQAVANSGNSSIRKGSLDSLKDNSWSDWNNSTTSVSTDECGDLVVSLTSTFDAKMKDLSVMKESKVETSSLSSDKELSDKEKPVSNDEDFRDPSLHKTSPSITLTKSSDAKIKGGDDKDKESEVLSDKENCNTKLRRSESLNKRGEEKKESCKLRRTESLNKRESKSNSDNKLKRSDSLTKNEKTESNLNKRRQLEAGKMYKMKRKTGGNNERSIKRRHTVGGTKDFDKVTWLDNRQAEENEKSRRTSSPDLSRHVLMEVRPWSLVEPTHVISRPLESHM